jgi:hypothetical protein
MHPPVRGQLVQTCDETLMTRPYMMNFEEVTNEKLARDSVRKRGSSSCTQSLRIRW